MEFFNETDKSKSLYHDFLSLLGLSESDYTTITTASYCRSANKWYHRAHSWIWGATGDWEYDDSTYTDLPIATTDLVDQQQDYELPFWAQDVERAEVLDSDGNYHLLTPFDKSQVTDEALSEFYETAGMPVYYDISYHSILPYPKPDARYVTLTKGLKVYFSRDINEFSSIDTSSEPGFIKRFHHILSVGPAYDYSPKYAPHMTVLLRRKIDDIKNEIEEFYGKRHGRAWKKQIIPHVEEYM